MVDSVHSLYLVATPAVLQKRLAGRQNTDLFDYALSRLRLIERLPYLKIDTSDLSPVQVADRILEHISQLHD